MKWLAAWMIALLLSLSGCGGRSTYNAAYRHAYYDTRYPDAVAEGNRVGELAATRAAKLGSSWRLYPTEGISGLLAGILVGLLIQYGLLVSCRRNNRIPSWLIVPFVPGITRTRCYEFLASRTMEWAAAEQQRDQIDSQTQQQLYELEAAYHIARQSLLAADSLDDLSRNKELQLAKRELSRIVTLAERRARQWKLKNTYRCPFCSRLIRYKDSIAGTETACPNEKCMGTIRLPELMTKSTTTNKPSGA